MTVTENLRKPTFSLLLALLFAWALLIPLVPLIQAADDVHPSAETDAKKAAAQGWVPAIPPGKNWNTYLVMPWQFQTDAVKDYKDYERVNLRSFHIDHGHGKYNLERRDFAIKKNWPFYLDHACGKGTLHLKVATKDKKGLIKRPFCLADPATIEDLKNLMKPRILDMMKGPVVAYSFDDEVSLGSFCSPVETDANELSIAGYRTWLKKQFGDIEKLNVQYGSKYKTFDTISPITYETARQTFKSDLSQVNLSHWSDWRSYMDTQFAETMRTLTLFANSIDPNIPAGFVGGQQPSPWGGYDYAKLRKVLQWIESYDIGASNEILRSFWPQTRPHVQTWGAAGASPIKSRGSIWGLWYFLAHGNRCAIMWPAGMFYDKDGKRTLSKKVEILADTFKEVQGPVSTKIINGTFLHDPIAIYYSHRSIQMGWAMDSQVHGSTWLKRFSSTDNRLSTSGQGRIAWLKSLEDLGYQGKFVADEDVVNGILIKDQYKVLILQRALCLSDAEVTAIKAFAAAGGTVIGDHLTGLFDARGKNRGGQGALDDLFGIKHDLTKGIFAGECFTEINGEKVYNKYNAFNLEHGFSMITQNHIAKPQEFAKRLKSASAQKSDPVAKRIFALMNTQEKENLDLFIADATDKKVARNFWNALNRILALRSFYDKASLEGLKLEQEAQELLTRARNDLWQREVERLNRRVFEAGFEGALKKIKAKPFAGHHAGLALCERGLSVTDGKPLKVDKETSAPVVIQKGKATYLNLSPISYMLERGSVDGQKWRKLLSNLMSQAGLKPRCTVKRDGKVVPSEVELIYWDNDGTTTLCVVGNFIHRTAVMQFAVSVDTGATKDSVELELEFLKPVKGFKDERTGKELGDGKRFKFSFKPWEANVFTYKE